jgi:hypothetical protein
MVRIIISIFLLLCCAQSWADDLNHVYKPNYPRSKSGSIIGSIRPRGLAYTIFLHHRETRKVVVCNVGLATRDYDFTIGRLEPGTYDMIITPFEKKNDLPRSKNHPILVGQGIPNGYGGPELDTNERALLKELIIKTLPATYKEVYVQRNADRIRKNPIASSQFKDEALEVKDSVRTRKLDILPSLGFMRDKKVAAPSDYCSTRTLVAIGGKEAKAYALTHCQERFIYPYYTRTYLEEGKTKQERVEKPSSMDYEYDELFLFSKVDGKWRVDLRRPINTSELIYHAKNFPERDINYRNVYYYTQGPLVGITVKAHKTRDLGTLTVPKLRPANAPKK